MGKLTDRAVKTAAPGRHMEGTVRGLTLLVQSTGAARSWVLRYQHEGKRRDMGLGPYPEVSLADARAEALDFRRILKVDKRDPLADRRRAEKEAAHALATADARTFKAIAEALIEDRRAGWGNAEHARQWVTTLEQMAFPKLGAMDVQAIETAHVLEVLRPIWATKTETASRVRQRIEAVLDYAKVVGKRTGENPARWKAHLALLLPKPSSVKRVEHHPALDWREAPAFMAELAGRKDAGAKPMAFAILTAARSGEVRGMIWGEVDDQAMVWTVPGARMKAGLEHRVPATAAARAVLGERGKADALVFPSPFNASRPLSDMTLLVVLRRMKRGDLTVHGFRSTFRDWAGETTAHPREVTEHALAHRLTNKAESAYQRGDLFVKRRKLMEDWASFLARPAVEVRVLPQAGVETA